MSSISVGQLILDAQKMASRVKDLDNLGGALLVEAEGNNRIVESLRQFQEDMDVLNRLSHNKTNAEIVNRIQQQNANSSEIIKENRELKVCLEDYEKAMELIMKKYREHTSSKILDAKINFKDGYNEGLWRIIREQREKINEMASVMRHAASIDDDAVLRGLENLSRLESENKTLRELLQISKQFGSANAPLRFNEYFLEEKGVQTDMEELCGDQSSFIGNTSNNNSTLDKTGSSVASTDNSVILPCQDDVGADNNNGPNIQTNPDNHHLDSITMSTAASLSVEQNTEAESSSEIASTNLSTTSNPTLVNIET